MNTGIQIGSITLYLLSFAALALRSRQTQAATLRVRAAPRRR